MEIPILCLAPLRGITDSTFRTIYSRHFSGISYAVAPFLNPQKDKSKKEAIYKDLTPENNLGLPVMPQLLDNTAEGFLNHSERLESMGYTEINWNLGCPAPMVTRKKRGSGLLPYPDMICSVLDSVLPKLKSRLSIKMRLGYNSAEESLNLLPRLNDYPVSKIIIHPRLGCQMYSGRPDIEAFAKCLELIQHPVSYNGDITSTDQFTQLAEKFSSVNTWMIGRGVVADPSLPEKILRKQSELQFIDRLSAFHQDLYDSYSVILSGNSHILGKMKQLWMYLRISFPESAKRVKLICKASTASEYLKQIDLFFSEQKKGSDLFLKPEPFEHNFLRPESYKEIG